MAAKTTTTAAPTREQLAAELRREILAALAPTNKLGLFDRVLAKTSDIVADSGGGVAELSAGFTAATRNFAVSYASAKVRQQQRTAAKVDALVAKQLDLAGL